MVHYERWWSGAVTSNIASVVTGNITDWWLLYCIRGPPTCYKLRKQSTFGWERYKNVNIGTFTKNFQLKLHPRFDEHVKSSVHDEAILSCMCVEVILFNFRPHISDSRPKFYTCGLVPQQSDKLRFQWRLKFLIRVIVTPTNQQNKISDDIAHIFTCLHIRERKTPLWNESTPVVPPSPLYSDDLLEKCSLDWFVAPWAQDHRHWRREQRSHVPPLF